MKNTIRFFSLLLLAALILIPSGVVLAQGESPAEGGKVIFGQNFTLKSGETFNGDLVVFGGNVIVEENASLNGDLVVFGGIVSSNGTIDGDVVVVGGQANLDQHAVVTKNVVALGGQLSQAEGAEIKGNIVNNVEPGSALPNASIPPVMYAPNSSVNWGFNAIASVFKIIFTSLAAAAFAMLLALFWKPQMERAGSVLIAQPVMVGAVGLLAVFLGALLFLTIIPPAIVGFALLFGMVALGAEVGERFTKAINQTWTPIVTVGFGTFLLVLAGSALGLIPCLGQVAQFLLALLEIGAAIVIWFGIRVGHAPQTLPPPPPQP